MNFRQLVETVDNHALQANVNTLFYKLLSLIRVFKYHIVDINFVSVDHTFYGDKMGLTPDRYS